VNSAILTTNYLSADIINTLVFFASPLLAYKLMGTRCDSMGTQNRQRSAKPPCAAVCACMSVLCVFFCCAVCVCARAFLCACVGDGRDQHVALWTPLDPPIDLLCHCLPSPPNWASRSNTSFCFTVEAITVMRVIRVIRVMRMTTT
jgi:hypothetical protein